MPIPIERRKEIASMGGRASTGKFKPGEERTRACGRKGGTNSGGNFRNNPERASEAGHKGGVARAATLIDAKGV